MKLVLKAILCTAALVASGLPSVMLLGIALVGGTVSTRDALVGSAKLLSVFVCLGLIRIWLIPDKSEFRVYFWSGFLPPVSIIFLSLVGIQRDHWKMSAWLASLAVGIQLTFLLSLLLTRWLGFIVGPQSRA